MRSLKGRVTTLTLIGSICNHRVLVRVQGQRVLVSVSLHVHEGVGELILKEQIVFAKSRCQRPYTCYVCSLRK